MAIWRDADLETLFEGSLDETGITLHAIDRLVVEGARESESLDFKAKLWGKGTGAAGKWSPEQEFAKDVGALANQRGGVLLVGVSENGGVAGTLSSIAPPASQESEERRLRQALINHLAPPAACDFIWVELKANESALAIVVPRSMRGPHAVMMNDGSLRYPLRHGADTIWLTEGEVADRYRRRLVAQDHAKRRVTDVTSGAINALTSSTGLWMYVAVVPETPALGRLDNVTLGAIQDWQDRSGFSSPLDRSLPANGRGIPAPGMVTFTDSAWDREQDETEIRGAYVELHLDGSAVVATPIADRTSDEISSRQVGEITVVDDAILLTDLALRWAAHQAGPWGLAEVVIGLVDTDEPDGILRDPAELVQADTGTVRKVARTRTVTGEVRATSVADLSAVDSLQQRLSVTHNVVASLLHWFGIAEPLQIKHGGVLVARQFTMSRYRQVEAWARQHGVDAELLD